MKAEAGGSVFPLDAAVDDLTKHLDVLIEAYQNAFDFIDSRPLLYVFSTSQGDRFMLRPVAQRFLEDHIRIIFISIASELRMVQFRQFNRISEDSRSKLNAYADFMEQSSKLFFSRDRVRAFLLFILVIITTASYFTGHAIDLTSLKGVAEWLLAINFRSIDTALILFFSGQLPLLILVLLLYVLSRNGFLPKRVILAGGTIRTKYGDFIQEAAFVQREFEESWIDIPEPNIYNLENKIYAILGTKKPVEFPLDLFLGNWAINFAFLTLLIVGLPAIYGAMYGMADSPVFKILIVFFILTLSLLIWYAIKAYKTYQKRKKYGNL